MARFRNNLPQLGSDLFITDGGLETTLLFHEGQNLPHFAAFHLLKSPAGEAAIRNYFRTYVALAKKFNVGLILESATWRANPDWGTKLGYSAKSLDDSNRRSIRLLCELRDEQESNQEPIVISGCIGPRGDGYVANTAMSSNAAHDYHQEQIATFAETEVDLVSAITMNYVEEAIGIVHAAREAKLPVAISFTVETDGRLPTGQALGEAIQQVDEESSGYPSYFMINCAHPSHFNTILPDNAQWTSRIRGLRANASRRSHAELNEATELDAGDPRELGEEYAKLKTQRLQNLSVMGGCCGTDHRHIEQIAAACAPLFRQ